LFFHVHFPGDTLKNFHRWRKGNRSHLKQFFSRVSVFHLHGIKKPLFFL